MVQILRKFAIFLLLMSPCWAQVLQHQNGGTDVDGCLMHVGYVLTWNGSAWECDAATGTTYSGTPNQIGVSGSTISLDPQFTVNSYGACTNTADALTMTPADAPTALADGLVVTCLSSAANTTTTPTLKVGTLAAKTIVKAGSSGQAALVANDILTNMVATFKYNATTTTWELQNPQQSASGGGLTSVGLAMPTDQFVVANSPLTSNGTIAVTKATQPPNTVYAGPKNTATGNVVQSTSGQGNLSASAAFSANVSAHNSLAIFVSAYGLSALTSSAGDSLTLGKDGSSTLNFYLYYTCDAVGGPTTISATGGWVVSIHAYEIFGTPTTSCLDQTGAVHTALASLTVSTSGSVSQSNEIVLPGFLASAYSSSITDISLSADYTRFQLTIGVRDALHMLQASGVGNVDTGLSGVQVASATTDAVPYDFMGIVGTFKINTPASNAPNINRSLVCADLPARTPCPIFATTLPGQTSAISDTLMTTAPSVAQLYRFSGSVNCTATSVSATATLNLKYMDTSNTAQTISAPVASCTSLGASSISDLVVGIRAQASSTITYGVTIVNTPTYDVDLRLEQMP